jgi:ATP phosphoribosyltransferase regulatory subunit HisZ
VLAAAQAKLPDTPAIRNALTSLAALAKSAEPHVEALHIDLADLTGYHYQNGAIFSVFTPAKPSAIGTAAATTDRQGVRPRAARDRLLSRPAAACERRAARIRMSAEARRSH